MTSRIALLALLFIGCGPAEQFQDTAVDGLVTSSNTNDESCPRTWAEARMRCSQPTPCTGKMSCWYPGVGDQLPSGKWADALLGCFDPSGTGAGEWRCAQ